MDTPNEFALNHGIATEETTELAKIELGKCYENIIELIKKYMDMPEEQIKLVAIWIIGTYFHNSFSSYPFLFINAMRGSGKTRLLKIISHLAKGSEGDVQTGITEAVLFRMPQGRTLILDECESIGTKEKAILREYLNACYKSGGAVKRMKKANFKGQEEMIIDTFHPYKPIALANIWGIDEVLGDRCISFVLEKSDSPSKTKMLEDFDTNPTFQEIKRTLDKVSVVSVMSLRKKTSITAWNSYIKEKYNDTTTLTTYTTHTTLTTQTTLEREIEEEFFNEIDNLNINGRSLELLFPMFIISNFLSGGTFQDIIKMGKELMIHRKEDEFSESVDVMVYEFVSKMEGTLEWQPLKELTEKFRNFAGSEEWMNERWLGKAFKRLNLIIGKRRMASGRFFILSVSKAKEKIKMFGGKDDIPKAL